VKWRFVSFQRYDPYLKTGLNQAVLESVAEGLKPVVFLAGWDRNCVNVGRSQVIEEEVDLEEVEKRSLDIVRRQGGGGTTYLTKNGEITWGIVAPENRFPDDVNQIYSKICSTIADAMAEIGIEAEHQPINDIVTKGKKISGATLRKENGAIYVGGTLLYDVDMDEMFSILTPDKEKLKGKQIKEFKDRVTSISHESDVSLDEVKKVVRLQLLEEKDWEESSWSKEELNRAEELANKYSSDKWLYGEQ